MRIVSSFNTLCAASLALLACADAPAEVTPDAEVTVLSDAIADAADPDVAPDTEPISDVLALDTGAG